MVRIAVASDDGKTIHQHFGRTSRFLIYEIDVSGAHLIEARENEPACYPGGKKHSESFLTESVDLVADCRAVLAAQIGAVAQAYLIRRNITPFQVTGLVETAINRLIRHINLITTKL